MRGTEALKKVVFLRGWTGERNKQDALCRSFPSIAHPVCNNIPLDDRIQVLSMYNHIRGHANSTLAPTPTQIRNTSKRLRL